MASIIRNAQRFAPGDVRYEYDAQAFANSDVITGTTLSLATGQTMLRLAGFLAVNKGATLLWMMFFDASSLPGNGATPILMPFPLVQNTPQALNDQGSNVGGRTLYAVNFKAGIVWAASTTPATLTVDATSSVWTTLWIH